MRLCTVTRGIGLGLYRQLKAPGLELYTGSQRHVLDAVYRRLEAPAYRLYRWPKTLAWGVYKAARGTGLGLCTGG